MSRFPGTGEFEAIVLHMEFTMDNDYHYARNTIYLTSKLTWGQRLNLKIHALLAKSSLCQNSLLTASSVKNQFQYNISIRMKSYETLEDTLTSNSLEFTSLYLDGREQIGTRSHINRAVDFISSLTFWSCTYSESLQNFRSYDILHDHVVSL